MNRLSFIFLVAMIQTPAWASNLCAQKKIQYGKHYLTCDELDWGVKPISADYQPSNAAPMTAPPSMVKGYQNDYPGIKNTQFYQEKNDLPLASKFYSAVSADPITKEDPSLAAWLAKDWYNGLQPKTNSSGWEGKCATWAGWSMDPELQKLFSGMRDGIICSGIPFSKGELKEIVTALYPEPSVDRKNFNKFYTGYVGANQDDLEDANVALSKLGMFGQGDLGPADVLEIARNAKKDGKNMMIDRDPGSEIWNQAIQKITDITYSDDQANVWESLTSAEFITNAGTPDQLSFLTGLASVESELTQNLLKGNAISSDRLCALRKKVGETCDDLVAKLTMSAQVEVINRLKKSAFDQNMIQTKQDVSIVKHEMVIEYGTENTFASNAPDKTVVQSYTYTTVNVANPDGSDGAVIRSQWSPRVNTLNDICKNQALAGDRNSTSMTRGFDVKQKCAEGKPINSALAQNEYFTGAVPPQSFKIFTAKPQFSTHQGQQQKAYNKLLEFMATCEHFDKGVDFLKHLDQVTLNNVISTQESDDLAKEYSGVKNLLDATYIQSLLGNKYQGVQGVELLKTKLKL